MTLSSEEIQTLFAFTEKKFVRWYDLQVELVDHLANKIEAAIDKNPSLSFDRALGNVYAEFGIFGFAEIVRERENALRKANNKLLWNEIKNQFTWPNLVRSLAILLLIYSLVIFAGLKVVIIFYSLCYVLDAIFNYKNLFGRNRFTGNRKPISKKRKNLLMLQSLPSFGLLPFFYFQFLIQHFFNVFNEEFVYTQSQKIFLILFLFIGSILFLASSSIAKSVLSKAKKLYPEAFA